MTENSLTTKAGGLILSDLEIAVYGYNPDPDRIAAYRYWCARTQRLLFPPKRCRQRKPRLPDGRKPHVERVSIEKAAAVLGPPVRTVQDLAARGEIPGAAKIGGRCTFDIEKLRRLVLGASAR